MTAWESATLRELSRVLFGQTYRLEVMLAIGRSPDGLVNLTDLAVELGVTPSNVQGSLGSLVAAGLISPMPHGDSKRRFYSRNPSLAWAWAIELASAADVHAGIPSG